ncbi:FCS-Like Zinc finger 8-like [Zingiber officinale]|uniref:FCS-Like Zinc finger 8-like n=1 Tax=Zingiber officinale TaxID=94328 RepID=UPI001C4D1E91|nr:FCS-Like Zinc finger 8-like [Zingiber officinale]
MSDPHSSNSSCCNKSRAFSIFSPRLFVGVSSSSSSDSEATMSPTSILETKSLSSIGRLLLSDATKSSGTESKLHARSFGDTDAVGLSIIDALNEEKSTKAFPNSESRRVVFGSLLKVQIPSLCPGSMSPVGSPIEFGVKNKESQLALLSPAQSSLGLEMTTSSACRVFARSISMSEMELSEDYTCVISHGPNPRTTHIFDNCVVESCGDGFTASIETNSSTPTDRRGHLSNDFLSFCYACKKDLGQGNDTFIYRLCLFTVEGTNSSCSIESQSICSYPSQLAQWGIQPYLLFLAAPGIHGGDSTDCPIDEEPKKSVANPALMLNQSP